MISTNQPGVDFIGPLTIKSEVLQIHDHKFPSGRPPLISEAIVIYPNYIFRRRRMLAIQVNLR